MGGNVWVLVGPSGTGKTSLAKALPAKVPNLKRAVTCTTRAPRPGEHEGVDYYFVTDEQFDFLLASGKLVESTLYGGARYGLPSDQFTTLGERDLVCVLDMAGVEHLRNLLKPGQIHAVFLESPSDTELAERMHARGSTPHEIARRLSLLASEASQAIECDYRVSTHAPYEDVLATLCELMAK